MLQGHVGVQGLAAEQYRRELAANLGLFGVVDLLGGLRKQAHEVHCGSRAADAFRGSIAAEGISEQPGWQSRCGGCRCGILVWLHQLLQQVQCLGLRSAHCWHCKDAGDAGNQDVAG